MTDKPIRIQRKRTKGWKMPPNTVCVDRTTHWGNLFKVGQLITVEHPNGKEWLKITPHIAVALYRNRMENSLEAFGRDLFKDLRGKNLACFCRLDQPCHADVLLEIANGGEV